MAIIPSNAGTCLQKTSNMNRVDTISELEKISNGTLFHDTISGAKYWYVIKTNFSGQINITIDIHTFYTANGSSKNFLFILFHAENQQGYLYDMKYE